MKKIINWKTFFILTAACTITSVMIIPYQIALSPNLAGAGSVLADDVGPAIYAAAFLQGLVIFSIVTFLGLILAPKVGFSLPILEGDNKLDYLKKILAPSILWGLAGGILITLLAIPFGEASIELFVVEMYVPLWARFLAIFYGGIAEEVLMRLFVMSLFAWAFMKIKVQKDVSIWIAIIISTVLFGVGHLPMTGAFIEITATVVLRAIILNGAGSIIFSLLFWKKGLESAIIAHFFATGFLRFVTPYIGYLIITS